MKKISSKLQEKIEKEIKMLLHAHRDCLRNQNKDTKKIALDCQDGYFGEAFGMMRTLEKMNYGKFKSSNCDGVYHGFDQPIQNLRWWFVQLEEQVLNEEGFYDKSHKCDYCFEKWGKDDTRKK